MLPLAMTDLSFFYFIIFEQVKMTSYGLAYQVITRKEEMSVLFL